VKFVALVLWAAAVIGGLALYVVLPILAAVLG
jgi:hypothetical protein